MQDWISYAVLFFAFCVTPVFILAVIAGTIWWLKRNASPQATPRSNPPPLMKTKEPQPAKKTTSPPRAAAKPATHRATPAAGATSLAATPAPAIPEGGYTPIYLNFSNKPRAIIENMDALAEQLVKRNVSRTRWVKGPRWLFWLGLAMIGVEVLLFFLGYSPSCVFLTGGLALWVVSIFLSVGLKRARTTAFPNRYEEFKQIVNTLRDDLRPGTGLIGNLDLTGARQASKVARSTKDAQNRTTQYFRDQWLNFKAKMYDGNILRVSAIQRVKERQAYTKRSRISGKMKLKPAKFKGAYQELKVRIAVNNELYEIARNSEIKSDTQIGEYTINAVDTEGGIITVLASSPKEDVSAQGMLGVLKFAYDLLKLKKA